ncbi:hypothetical protein V7S57_02485 [Caulobacter sp. CCNWLY153]|uniref:hypothetical protein n=1 Tax=unclassified Caulobacter TaxID=2648921 RepID=UPI002FF39696
MIVILFDRQTRRITECRVLPEADAMRLEQPWREVFEDRPDWDVTHEMDENDDPVPRDPAVIQAEKVRPAMSRLRVGRDALLREQVDPLVMNPLRWSALWPDQQSQVVAYRQALLDWPAAETDPLNPTPPTKPEFL